MSDPVLDALNAAAQRGAAPPPGQPMSAPAGGAPAPAPDPVLSALQQRVAQPDATPTPTAPPRDLLQQTGDFLAAGVHHAASLPWALGQIMSNAVAAPFKWLPDNPVSRSVVSFAADNDRIVANREAQYQASTPNSAGAYAGATAGALAQALMLGGGLQGAGDAAAAKAAPYLPRAVAPIGGRVISGATQGAIVGATTPVVMHPLSLDDLVAPEAPQDGSFWDQKADQVGMGAAFGAALPAVTAPLSAAWNAGKRVITTSPILNPTGYAARQVGIQLGADAPTVADNLANSPQYVPGSIPTSAQAGGSPALVMMEKSLATGNKPFQAKLQDRLINNNAARWDAINGVAGTPDDLQAAIDARDAATAPMRDLTVTNGNPVPVDSVLDAINGVRRGPLGMRPTIGGATNDMATKVQGVTTTIPADTLMNTPASATASPGMLDALRQNSNDYLSKYAPNGVVGTQEQAAMMPIKSAIVDAIDAGNPRRAPSAGGWGQGLEQAGPTAPGYRDYLNDFARRSIPINTMEAGQMIADQLGVKSTDASGLPLLTLSNYTGRLAAALRASQYGIDPAALASLEGVQSDLQRATASSARTLGSGSDTAWNQGAGATFLKSLGAAGGNAGAANAGAATLAATGSAKTAGAAAFGVKKASDFFTGRVANSLGDLLLDPQRLSQALMEQSPALAPAAPSAFGRIAVRNAPALNAALAAALMKHRHHR